VTFLKEIGGFYELELNRTQELYLQAVKLNNGRACLACLLEIYQPEKIYIPHYICNCMLRIVEQRKVNYQLYHLDQDFMPVLNAKKNKEYLLYVNYFGLHEADVKKINTLYSNVIIDNSQAFFSKPLENCDTFYSARKFFGVPDGSYLFTKNQLKKKLKKGYSYNNCKHLLKRIDVSAENAYLDFQKNENRFDDFQIKSMSSIAMRILQSIDYQTVQKTRTDNFLYLNQELGAINEIQIDTRDLCGPMVYPLFIKKEGLREYLIRNKIFVATYWHEVLDRVEQNTFEYQLSRFLIPLPIDQRYNKDDMQYIIEKIKNYLNLP
jgi:hypothetical protein